MPFASTNDSSGNVKYGRTHQSKTVTYCRTVDLATPRYTE
uniref:Uncharacterized protein n=1 Tax=Anguilla anguilla TaxID=7936 RepID=A0A0E9SE99_ANGAN